MSFWLGTSSMLLGPIIHYNNLYYIFNVLYQIMLIDILLWGIIVHISKVMIYICYCAPFTLWFIGSIIMGGT